MLSLSNKFLEICFDFTSSKESLLHEKILSLCRWYVHDFSENQFWNFLTSLEWEEWWRLPLPDNYKIEENEKLMSDYPKNFWRHIWVFKQLFDGKIEKFKQNEVFAELLQKGNPFSNSKLMNSWSSKIDPYFRSDSIWVKHENEVEGDDEPEDPDDDPEEEDMD